MYGKIFDSMYDSTISANWQGMVTFQQLIVLSDSDGVIDMTPPAISRRTGIPLDIIEVGIEYLESPDVYSRNPNEDGKRIIRLDEHRPWGWQIVNHKHYTNLSTREEKKEYDKIRYQSKKSGKAFKESEKASEKVEKEEISQVSTDSTHTDTDTDTDKDLNTTRKSRASTSGVPFQAIVDKWNAIAERNGLPQTVKITSTLKGQIRQRWKDLPKLENWDNFFEYIEGNDFLAGRSSPGHNRDRPFRSALHWITKEGNFAKIAAKEYE